MSIQVEIYKKLKAFELEVGFETSAHRIGILGASGCGKSMTLKCIAGIERPDRGKVRIDDKILLDTKHKLNIQPQKRKVGYLFQNYALFPNMTVIQNVGIGIRGTKKEIERKAIEQIRRFHLEGMEKRYPTELSGGQQQRVALARIFAYEPEVILLDEPFSALDSFLKDQLQQQLLESLQDFSGDIMMVSHSRDELYTFCDKLIVMENGRPLRIGETKEIFNKPQKVEVARLTGCKNISAIKKIGSHEVLAMGWGIRLHTEQQVKDHMNYIGIRAHDLIINPENEVENTFDVQLTSQLELPFEMQYYVKTDACLSEELICVKVNKDRQGLGNIGKIKMPSEALMLLEG